MSTERGATRIDDDAVVWLCAIRRREDGSDDDAFARFAQLHASRRLLPTDDDHLRDLAEEALRLDHRPTSDLFGLVDRGLAKSGTECASVLDSWFPARVLVIQYGGVEEIWCGICVRATDGAFIRPELRDVLFASLEAYVSPVVFEARDGWCLSLSRPDKVSMGRAGNAAAATCAALAGRVVTMETTPFGKRQQDFPWRVSVLPGSDNQPPHSTPPPGRRSPRRLNIGS
ncbi:MAG TPA: hypothetical protein VNG12_11025 [Acidimicrobiales bacterium]|nr:hypothetical protein [Acidimicrobiales bacterium]